jgi:hypothetical protein
MPLFDFSRIPSPPNFAGALPRNFFGSPRIVPGPGNAGVNLIRTALPISPGTIPPVTAPQFPLSRYRSGAKK